MNSLQDPSGAAQSYIASIMAPLVLLTQSDIWAALIAVLAATVLVIRLYKEIRGLFHKDD